MHAKYPINGLKGETPLEQFFAAIFLMVSTRSQTHWSCFFYSLELQKVLKKAAPMNPEQKIVLGGSPPLTACRLTNASLLFNAVELEKKCTEFLRTRLRISSPVYDFRILDKDFALNLLENAFYNVS